MRDESDDNELMNAVLPELQIQIGVGKAAGTPMLEGHDVAHLRCELAADLATPGPVLEGLMRPGCLLDGSNAPYFRAASRVRSPPRSCSPRPTAPGLGQPAGARAAGMVQTRVTLAWPQLCSRSSRTQRRSARIVASGDPQKCYPKRADFEPCRAAPAPGRSAGDCGFGEASSWRTAPRRALRGTSFPSSGWESVVG